MSKSKYQIEFFKTKKVLGNYFQIAHVKRKGIIKTYKHLDVYSKIYMKKNKLYIDLSFDDNSTFMKKYKKYKNYTINYICEKYKEKNITKEQIEKNYIEKIKKVENINIFTFEIHPNCIFECSNQFDEIKKDNCKNIIENIGINAQIQFKGIIYGKSTFTNYFVIHKIIRNYEEEEKYNNCIITDESDDEEIIDNNDEKYINTYRINFPSFFNIIEEEKVKEKVKEKEIKREIKENTDTDIIKNIINNIIEKIK